jgi:hypothetical protein
VYQYLLLERDLERTTKDQLRRASFESMLNIPKTLANSSVPDRKTSFVVAGDSVFECSRSKTQDFVKLADDGACT